MSAFAESFETAAALIVHADADLLHTVALSLQVSGTACLAAAGVGLALGAWLAIDGKISAGAMIASNALMGNALRPIGIIYWIEVVVLVAWCEKRRAIRHFRLDRTGSCRVLKEDFRGEGDALRAKWQAEERSRA